MISGNLLSKSTNLQSSYVELHCHSYYSLLDGASSPEELVERASELSYPALALTDRNGLYGAVRFWRAARERGIRPLIGAEAMLADGGALTLLAGPGRMRSSRRAGRARANAWD
jgi:error-prone DNA polymerase